MILANSGRFKINGLDIKSIGRTAIDGIISVVLTLIPMFAVGATYHLGSFDLTPFVAIAGVVIVKAIRKWATDHSFDVPAGQ